MKRYEYILKGGKEELTKAIGFCLATYEEATHGEEYSCEMFCKMVKLAQEKIMPWLEAEVEE